VPCRPGRRLRADALEHRAGPHDRPDAVVRRRL